MSRENNSSAYSRFLGNGEYQPASSDDEDLFEYTSYSKGSATSIFQRRTSICLIVLTILLGLFILGFVVLLVLHLQLLNTNQDLQAQIDQLSSTSTQSWTTTTSFEIGDNTTDNDGLYLPPAWGFVGPNISNWGIGSINSITSNADFTTIYVGSSNGGVWKTSLANGQTSLAPDNNTDNGWLSETRWQVLTDGNECLSAAAVSVSPNDSNFLAYACGKVSSYLFYSGPLAGIFYSHDAGASWSIATIDPAYQLTDFTSLVVLSGSGTAGTGRIIAGAKARRVPSPDSGFVWTFDYTQGGIFLSTDSGQSFQACTDPLVDNVPIFDIRQDPQALDNVYAVTGSGDVLFSQDYGQHWSKVSQGIDTTALGSVVNARVAIFAADGEPTIVYVVLCNSTTGGLIAWAQSAAADGDKYAWSQEVIPDDIALYGGVFFLGLSADPVHSNLAYIVGAVASAYVVDTSSAPGEMFRSLTNSSEPHADMRTIYFTSSTHNVMYVGCDGGIYSLEDPSATTSDDPDDFEQTWQAHNGNLAITEMDSIAYDARSNSYASGAQDNGVWLSVQASIDEGYSPGNFYTFDVGDGETAAFNTKTNPSVLYASGQELGGFFSFRIGGDPNNLNYIELPDEIFDDTPFYTDIQINSVNPSLIMSCSGSRPLCWQFDFGADPLNTKPTVTTLIDLGPDQQQVPFTNYFYGGRRNNEEHGDVVFAIAGNSFIYGTDPAAGLTFQLPSNVQWYLAKDSMQLRNPKYRLAVNPEDYYELVTCTMSSRIHRSTDFGQSWKDITGNLVLVTNAISDPLAWGVAIVPFAAGQSKLTATLVGTPGGIFVSFSDSIGQWYSLSEGSVLPHVLISNLLFDSAANILIANTMGRGWWRLDNALETILAVYHTHY